MTEAGSGQSLGAADTVAGNEPDDVSRETVEAELLAQLFGDQADIALRYRDILADRGTRWGLLGPREVGRLWSRHVLNCAAVTELLLDGITVVDVGSGAGLPGIPIALARPDTQVVLVEPLERRSTFLVDVVGELGLTDRVRVVRARAEEARGQVEPVHVVVARAVAPLRRLIPLLVPLAIRPGGRVLAMKGARAAEELAAARSTLRPNGVARAQIHRLGGQYLDPPATVVELKLHDR